MTSAAGRAGGISATTNCRRGLDRYDAAIPRFVDWVTQHELCRLAQGGIELGTYGIRRCREPPFGSVGARSLDIEGK